MAEEYASQMSVSHGLKIIATKTAKEAVLGADIVITATQADHPIVRREWLSRGSVSVSLGSYQEFDDASSLEVDKVYVDSWEQCAHRGELARLVSRGLFTKDHLTGEIGDVMVGKVDGRTSDDEVIMTVPIGLGSLDIAIGRKVYDKAKNSAIGSYFVFA